MLQFTAESPCDDVFIDKLTHFTENKSVARAKQERIMALQTENAMLYLKIAKCQSEIKSLLSENNHQRRIIEEKDKVQKQYAKSLCPLRNELKVIKESSLQIRNDVAQMPKRLDDSIQQMITSTELYGNEMIIKSHNQSKAFKDMTDKVDNLEGLVKKYKDLYDKEKERRKMLHNTLVELRGNIRVHCRIRPVLSIDDDYVDDPIKAKTGPKDQVIFWQDEENVYVRTSSHLNRIKNFEYERVYCPTDIQGNIFTDVAPLLTSLLDGYNVCIMAYGQTGSGKTYTMLGDHKIIDSLMDYGISHSQEGVIPRAARELFRLIAEENQKHPKNYYTVELSVAEVYNNNVRDLLSINEKDSSEARYVEIVTSADGSHDAQSLITRHVTNVNDVMEAVRYGMVHRHKDATLIHKHSSRSHLIVTITITTTTEEMHASALRKQKKISADSVTSSIPRSDNKLLKPTRPIRSRSVSPGRWASTPAFSSTKAVVKTKLQLVDLAGSECVGMSGVTGSALRETHYINRSLSALADVLGALAENRTHVPYRNSKLTQLLQDSIGGDAKLLVFLCVSPVKRHMAESLQCLGFGSRARQIQRGAAKQYRPQACVTTSGNSSSSEDTASGGRSNLLLSNTAQRR